MQYTAPLGPFFFDRMHGGEEEPNRNGVWRDAQSLVRPTRKAKPLEAAPHSAKQNACYRE